MCLHMENCVFCGTTNLFYKPSNSTDDGLLSELMNDIVLLESTETQEIKPLSSSLNWVQEAVAVGDTNNVQLEDNKE